MSGSRTRLAIYLFATCLLIYSLLMTYMRWSEDEGDGYLEPEDILIGKMADSSPPANNNDDLPSSNWHCHTNLIRIDDYLLCNPQAFPTKFNNTCQIYSISNAKDPFGFESGLAQTIGHNHNHCQIRIYISEDKEPTPPIPTITITKAKVVEKPSPNAYTINQLIQLNNGTAKFPLLKINTGLPGIALLTSQLLKVIGCQAMITLPGNRSSIRSFLLKMKKRAYFMYAYTKREEDYRMSFFNFYCEHGGDFVYRGEAENFFG